ncbi:MAG: hypothetical protein ACLT1A_12135 [Dysosmobacter sp.]
MNQRILEDAFKASAPSRATPHRSGEREGDRQAGSTIAASRHPCPDRRPVRWDSPLVLLDLFFIVLHVPSLARKVLLADGTLWRKCRHIIDNGPVLAAALTAGKFGVAGQRPSLPINQVQPLALPTLTPSSSRWAEGEGEDGRSILHALNVAKIGCGKQKLLSHWQTPE